MFSSSFYLNLVYELYNDNKPCPRMHEPPPPSPPRGTRIQKNRFHCTNFCKFRDQQNHKYVIYIILNDELQYLILSFQLHPTFLHSKVPFSRTLLDLTFRLVYSIFPDEAVIYLQTELKKAFLKWHTSQHHL